MGTQSIRVASSLLAALGLALTGVSAGVGAMPAAAGAPSATTVVNGERIRAERRQ